MNHDFKAFLSVKPWEADKTLYIVHYQSFGLEFEDEYWPSLVLIVAYLVKNIF